MRPARAGMYLRVSTLDQNTDLQRRDVEAFCAAKGFEVTVFEDAGRTGTNARRPELQKMLRECRERKLDVVVCWKMDRLFRSLKDLVNTLSEWDALGVQFVAVKDHVDLSTPAGRLMMQMLGSFAEFEAALIRERVRAGVQAARARGVRMGRPMERDDALIRELRSQGLSLRDIAERAGCSRMSVLRGLRKTV